MVFQYFHGFGGNRGGVFFIRGLRHARHDKERDGQVLGPCRLLW